MTRLLFASLLAASLLAWSSPVFAGPPKQCAYGYGSGGIALNLFSKLHQHGPLFNYGPYYGYPPFEPYGPWNAYLQYNPGYYGDSPGTGRSSRDWHLGNRDRCGTCSWHAHWRHGGWFRGHGCLSCGDRSLFHRHGRACSPCGATTPAAAGGCSAVKPAAFDSTADPVTRYAGIGDAQNSAYFYAGLPSLDPNLVVAAGR